jgi:hypothetical protein
MTTTTVQAVSQSSGIVQVATGKFTSDGNATILNLGFKARVVELFNETDVIVWKKFEGQAAADTLKMLSHDTAQVNKDTGSAIVINTDGTVTISATAAGTSKVIYWTATA